MELENEVVELQEKNTGQEKQLISCQAENMYLKRSVEDWKRVADRPAPPRAGNTKGPCTKPRSW